MNTNGLDVCNGKYALENYGGYQDVLNLLKVNR